MTFAETAAPDWLRSIAENGHTPTPALQRPQLELVPLPRLSTEQESVVDAAASGHDILVNATVGSGKTSTIMAICEELGDQRSVLYLTYSKLLKADARLRVRRARVQNYHGVVYPSLKEAGIEVGISESVGAFNAAFEDLKHSFPRYQTLVVDEYQDINEEYAQLIRNIKSLNPSMQIIMVGDPEQRVHANSNLDTRRFAAEVTRGVRRLPMTRSFRMGPLMGELLSLGWNKPVIGVNEDQVVRVMDQSEAIGYMLSLDPADMLVLGKRSGGALSSALNSVEYLRPEVFNKNTVYASIRDRSEAAEAPDGNAIFTTFDASKGMERPVAFVYDMDEAYFDTRVLQPGSVPEVVRNIFLVAASRGKAEIVFVQQQTRSTSRWRDVQQAGRDGADPDDVRELLDDTVLTEYNADEPAIGVLPIERLVRLPGMRAPQYRTAMDPAHCFDHTYAENVIEAVETIQRTRLDPIGAEINIPNLDGLIDLAPVIDSYIGLMYFDDARAEDFALASMEATAIARYRQLLSRRTRSKQRSPWNDALFLTAVTTDQERYLRQVEQAVSAEHDEQIIARLGQHLPRDARALMRQGIDGLVRSHTGHRAQLSFEGHIDALHDERAWVLKFAAELTREAFLEAAMHAVMGELPEAMLMNVRTGERWQVRVPDRQRFLDAVTTCVTKQAYQTWRDQ